MINKKGFGQMQFFISLIFISLFAFAIIAFTTQFASDNNAAVTLADDDDLQGIYNNSASNVSALSQASEDTYESIVDTSISPFGSAQSVAPFTLTTSNALGTTKDVAAVGYRKIFGSGNAFGIFITALVFILGFMAALLIYKSLRGQPD